MIKPVIIYNKKDFVANHFYELLFKFYSDIVLIDDADIFSEDGISTLKDKLTRIKNDGSTLNLLFFIEYDTNKFNSILELEIVNQYRLNFVFFKVPYNEESRSAFKKFNSRFNGTTVFSWIVGERDSNDNQISNVQLNTAFFSWIILLSSGALSFVAGDDVFYEQQNLRDTDNHVFILKSRVIFNKNLSQLLESIQQGWFTSITELNVENETAESFMFPKIQKKGDEDQRIEINDGVYPTYKSIGNFKSIREFEKLIKDFVHEFETNNINPAVDSFSKKESIYYKNNFEKISKSAFENFKESLKTKFLSINNFRFNLVKSYISNSVNRLGEKTKKHFSFDFEDLCLLINTATENEVFNIIKVKKDISRWISLKNKKRFIVYALTSSLVLMIITLLIFLYINLEISFNIISAIIITCLAISSGFWYWRYSVGLDKLKKLLSKQINNLNVKMHKTIDTYLESIPFNLSRFIKTHWHKKLSSRMIINLQLLQNGFNRSLLQLNSISKDLNNLVDGKKGSTKLNVDVNEIKKIIYNDYLHEMVFSNSPNLINLQKKVINGMFNLVINELKEMKLKFDDLNLSDFEKQEIFVDKRYLTNVERGLTSPKSKGRFVVKPRDYEIKNINLDNIMFVDKYDSVLMGEYFKANLD